MAARKKKKKVFSRKIGGGYANAPTDSFWAFKDYARTEIDKKETAKVIKEYIRKNFPKKDIKIMMECPEWRFTVPYYVASTIVWHNLEKEIPAEWNHKPLFKRYFDELIKAGKKAIEEKEEDKSKKVGGGPAEKKSPAEIIAERTSDFLAELDATIDRYHTDEHNGKCYSKNTHDAHMSYSLYNELMKVAAPYNMGKAVYDHLVPIRDEIKELVDKCPKDLDEAYDHMNKTQRKRYLEYLETLVKDADRYVMSKKAARKSRAPKKKTADKQVKQLKYLKDSKEFMLTSISPMDVPGSHRLFVFNTKNRKLTEYVSNHREGFEIKGTTLQRVDFENSREVTLRKPDEMIPVVQKKTTKQIDREWAKLTTKTSQPNGRINKDMILLRVMDK